MSTMVVPEIFQNCSSEYRIKDIKYIQCHIPMNVNPCKLLKELHEAKDIRKYLFATIPLILATIAILINITYGILIIELWRRKKLGSLCRYSFLISRTISSILALILLYIVLIAWKFEIFRYASAAAFILIGSISFLTLAGTYVAMTALLYLAIVHPLKYLYLVNVKRCFIVIAILWLISIAFSLFLGFYGATLFYPQTAPIYCSFNRCQQPIAIFIVFMLCVFFIIVIAFYLIILYFIHNRDRTNQLDTDITIRNNVRTMNRLALNMVTFTIGSLPILIVAAIATANLKNLTILGLGDKSSCKTFLHGRLFLQVEILACTAAIVWVLAMIFDPIINFFADPNFIDSIRSWFSCIKFQIPPLRLLFLHKSNSNS
ncbi:Ribokinase, putative [Brugia malayi]|uniref:Ribokinase, putative n=1 Tax=Brugia malayi TaxID=6279 RepID=A0A4E9FA85_BRUMA|nr:Ribokinase, putative [Brugia malayi]VIO93065.1 Ribokinase, putative [Brugia malayi]